MKYAISEGFTENSRRSEKSRKHVLWTNTGKSSRTEA